MERRRGLLPVAAGQRSPPGSHSTSVPSAFAARARMNRRSLSRFRYATAQGIHGSGPRRLEDLALGTAADRTGDVQARGAFRSTRQDEALQLGQAGVRVVAVGLQPVDRGLSDPELPVAVGEGHGQVGTDVEELVLNA